MNKSLRTTILFLLVGALPSVAQTKKPTVQDLAWLAGCWEKNFKGSEINEQWMKPSGRMMLGAGRTVFGGKTDQFEFLQIVEKDDAIFYVAKPSGQPEGSFKLIKFQNREAVFENPEHDFPQRIIYRLQPDGSLFTRIEGTTNGNTRGYEDSMKRGRCD